MAVANPVCRGPIRVGYPTQMATRTSIRRFDLLLVFDVEPGVPEVGLLDAKGRAGERRVSSPVR